LFKPPNLKLSQPECRAIPFQRCPARAYIGPSGSKEIGKDLIQHCQIVRSVVAELVARMPLAISTQLFSEGPSLVSACHDIGKVSPIFAKKILSNTSGRKPEHTPELKGINANSDKGWGGHPGVSQVTAKALDVGEHMLEILGQHHGFPPPVDIYRADCCAYVLGLELGKSIMLPQQAFGSTAWVYSPYVLCRSLEIWQKRTEAEPMSRWIYELVQGNGQRTGQKALKHSARITLATSGKTLPESKAQTRYSDAENADVLLLQSIDLIPDDKTCHLLLLDGSSLILPWHRSRLDKPHWRKLAANMMRQVGHVRFAEAPEPILRSLLKKIVFRIVFIWETLSRIKHSYE